ncbi:MAG: hypothetical protein ABI604_18600 [Nitrospirota bacterium]
MTTTTVLLFTGCKLGLTEEQAGIAALQKMGGSLAQAFPDELLAMTREQGK